jgi:hypothetical protein
VTAVKDMKGIVMQLGHYPRLRYPAPWRRKEQQATNRDSPWTPLSLFYHPALLDSGSINRETSRFSRDRKKKESMVLLHISCEKEQDNYFLQLD